MKVSLIQPSDNVVVALADLSGGDVIDIGGAAIRLRDNVTLGHKVALDDLVQGGRVVKYGQVIGHALCGISAGDLVHTHNLGTGLIGHRNYQYRPNTASYSPVASGKTSTERFLGYRRDTGSVGTRNEIWILVTVGCVNRLAQRLALITQSRYGHLVDGIYALPHPFGCSQTGADQENTRRLIRSLCCHPNAGGVLLVSLGCETNTADDILSEIPAARRARIRLLHTQKSPDEFEDGLRLIDELVELVSADQRTPCAAGELVVGLKCGGSDAFSGITANPLVGEIADFVTENGGRAILTEVPEMFGAEHLLMNRAVSIAVYQDILSLIAKFKDYFLENGESIAENPSPGNIAGGITTLEEKSLGAIQKGGKATITQVCAYGQQASEPGLVLVEAPGNDAISSTALVAAGATIVLFTTGRGTPLAPPVPTLKISSNSDLATRKPSWIDFDAGQVLVSASAGSVKADLVALLLRTASGDYRTASEQNDQREIAVWKTGVTL